MTEDKKRALKQELRADVEEGYSVGVQAAVYEKGQEIFYDAYGMADRERGIPMGRDSVCRIYSMTKPVTAAAAWILKERGLLDFSMPVEKYLPEFAHMQVLEGTHVVPAKRSILIEDLLSMTSGLVYPDADEAGRRMEEQFEDIENAIRAGRGFSTREVLGKIAGVPLCAQPGTQWRYGLSADVLGGVIQEVSGKSLAEFFLEEIFEPLEMRDTAFYVPEEKQGRFAQLYKRTGPGACGIDRKRHLGLTMCLEPPAFQSGGAGLVSTIEDYSHFACMLAAGGVWKGKRILSEETVEAFSRNMLPTELLGTISFAHMKGYGYGNLMRVNLGRGESFSTECPGEFGWDGWTGPYFTVDRNKQKVFLFMVQVSDYQHWDRIWKMRDIVFGE
ncbi:serine hydrolase domain-containing protein [Ruminococcus sp. 5_1_39BFAA]|uniref:serine hydrolase domain-containing protein n=1 Tax=Ruminococcus sp. 5_1_39BFAA TaxID=457412 RepID=UPI0035624908